MKFYIEQTLSKPTVQFGLRVSDYLTLIIVGCVGNFFVPRLWLVIIMVALIVVFRYVNTNKPRYFWSSWVLWFSNTNLDNQQTQKLPPIIRR